MKTSSPFITLNRKTDIIQRAWNDVLCPQHASIYVSGSLQTSELLISSNLGGGGGKTRDKWGANPPYFTRISLLSFTPELFPFPNRFQSTFSRLLYLHSITSSPSKASVETSLFFYGNANSSHLSLGSFSLFTKHYQMSGSHLWFIPWHLIIAP